MTYRGGGSGSAPSPLCSEDEATQENKTEKWDALFPKQSDHPRSNVYEKSG